MPKSPRAIGEQTEVHLTLHFQPVSFSSCTQRNSLQILSISLENPVGARIAVRVKSGSAGQRWGAHESPPARMVHELPSCHLGLDPIKDELEMHAPCP